MRRGSLKEKLEEEWETKKAKKVCFVNEGIEEDGKLVEAELWSCCVVVVVWRKFMWSQAWRCGQISRGEMSKVKFNTNLCLGCTFTLEKQSTNGNLAPLFLVGSLLTLFQFNDHQQEHLVTFCNHS